MDNFKREVVKLMKQYGAVLIRSKKHDVWRLPNGKTIGVSTSSNSRAIFHIKKDILRLLNEN